MIVCDTRNHLLREVNLKTKTVKTIAGIPKQRGFDRTGGNELLEQSIASPWDIVRIDQAKFYVCMAGTHQIWALDLLNVSLVNCRQGLRTEAEQAQRSARTAETKLQLGPSLQESQKARSTGKSTISSL